MIITIANAKGGNSKTTTAQVIATGAKGKTLAIDLDPQANLSLLMAGNALDAGAFELLTGQATPAQTIQKTAQGDIIPASLSLINADAALKGDARIFALRDALKPIKKKYDNIVIDTAPGASVLLLNALAASDAVLIPMQADLLSIQGLSQLAQTVAQVKRDYNPKLKIAGFFFTRYNGRTLVSKELTETIKEQAEQMGVKDLEIYIPEGVAVKEAQLARESLFKYSPKSKPAKEYKKLLDKLGLL